MSISTKSLQSGAYAPPPTQLPSSRSQELAEASASIQRQYRCAGLCTDFLFSATVIYLMVLSVQQYLQKHIYSSSASGSCALVIICCYAYLRRYANITSVMNRLITELQITNSMTNTYINTLPILQQTTEIIQFDIKANEELEHTIMISNRVINLLDQIENSKENV